MSDIDLGVSAKDKYSLSDPMKMDNKETCYPCLHYCGPKDLDLPDEGELTIRFRKKREVETTEEGGSCWYECDIEVRAIIKVDGEAAEVEAPASSRDDAGDALDAIREALERHGQEEKY